MFGFMVHLRHRWRHYLPLALLVAGGLVFAFTTGLHRELTLDALALRYGALAYAIAQAPLLSTLAGLGIYIAFVVFAIPGVWLLSVAYGLLFGWLVGLSLIMVSASIGASILYWAARTVFRDYFRKRAGPRLMRLAEGFRKNAASYLLFLRFAPMFPFVIVNVAPGVLGVSYRTFVWTTLVGIGPASAVYAYAGQGLRGVVTERAQACLENTLPCGQPLSPFDILTPPVLFALALLALISLLPVLIRQVGVRRSRQPRP